MIDQDAENVKSTMPTAKLCSPGGSKPVISKQI